MRTVTKMFPVHRGVDESINKWAEKEKMTIISLTTVLYNEDEEPAILVLARPIESMGEKMEQMRSFIERAWDHGVEWGKTHSGS